MPRYFIDIDDGDHCRVDEDGHDLDDDAAARLAALDALPDMAREKIPDSDGRTFVVRVRKNDSGSVIYRATLDLKGSGVGQKSQHAPKQSELPHCKGR